MKKLSLLLVVAAGLATSGLHAQTSEPDGVGAKTDVSAKVAATPAARQVDSATKEAAEPSGASASCLRATGSRIVRRNDDAQCVAQNGRAYEKTDLDRTGRTNLTNTTRGHGLRSLDPAVR